MVKPASLHGVALLAGLAAAAAAGAGGEVNSEVEQRLAELRRLIEVDGANLKALEGAASRALADPPEMKSIFGATPVALAYTQHEATMGAITHMWLLLCGALVFCMQAGFALIVAGNCRAKNVHNVFLLVCTNISMAAMGWWLFGWAFSFGGPYDRYTGFKSNRFAGGSGILGTGFVSGLPDSSGRLEPTWSMGNWFFQWTVCCVASAIAAAGVVERVKVPGMMLWTLFFPCFIYPIVAAWTWGKGFLADMNSIGYFDFAGSGVVHMTGGIAALMGAIIAGARDGRFPEDWDRNARIFTLPPGSYLPHSHPMIVLGTFILWFGWYGLNCGATKTMNGAKDGFMAGHVAMNTTLAAACGGCMMFVIRYAMYRKFDVGGVCRGILAGLVSISAGCGNSDPGTAVFAGMMGALIYQLASSGLLAAKIDDPLDAFPIHGACGIWGVFAAGIFGWGGGSRTAKGGAGFGNLAGAATGNLGHQLLAANLAEIACVTLWAGVLSAIAFAFLRMMQLLGTTDPVEEAPKAVEYDFPPLQSI